MKNIILTIKIDGLPEFYEYYSNDKDIDVDDLVVIDTERGRTIGRIKRKKISDKDVKFLKKIIRKINKNDLKFLNNKKSMEDKALKICKRLLKEENIKMKLIKVDYMLNYSKVIFYFTSEKRVDFRSLVKKLAYNLRTRIEMRQIGVRDEAKIIGGIGICGREVCCKNFMNRLEKVPLDKVNKLNLVNEKVIGICGKFMCCLLFEENKKDKEKDKENK